LPPDDPKLNLKNKVSRELYVFQTLMQCDMFQEERFYWELKTQNVEAYRRQKVQNYLFVEEPSTQPRFVDHSDMPKNLILDYFTKFRVYVNKGLRQQMS